MPLSRLIKKIAVLFTISLLFACVSPENINPLEDSSDIKYLETKNQKNDLITAKLVYTIDCPTEKVFAYLINPESVPEWQSDISEQVKITKGSMKTGTILRNTKRSLFRSYQYERKIIDFKSMKTYAFYNYDKYLEFEMRYNLMPESNNVQLMVSANFKKPVKGLYSFIPGWLLKYGIKTVFLKHHRQFKINIENKC